MEEICRINGLRCHAEPPRLVVRSATDPLAEEVHPISIDLLNADLHETLRTFGAITDTTVTIDPELASQQVTVTFDAVPWTLALDEICRLSGCVTEATAEGISITALPPETVAAGRLDLALEGTSLASVLERFRGLPLWGGAVTLEVEPSVAETPVTIDLRQGAWTDLLDALCDAAACKWKLVFDRHGHHTLRITDLRGSLMAVAAIGAFEGTLAESASAIGKQLGLAVQVIGGLRPETPVSWPAGERSGSDLLESLCTQADCRWHLRGHGVQLVPRNPRFATSPATGRRGPTVSARLVDGTSASAASLLRFTWSHSIARLGREGDWQATLVWLPFGEGRQALLPILVDCSREQPSSGRVVALDPIALPLRASITLRHGEVGLELVPKNASDESTHPEAASRSATTCEPTAAKTEAVIATAGDAPDQRLVLELDLGRFLLMTPPGERDTPQPEAALVALGTDDAHHALLALVEPRPGGTFELTHISVGARAVTTELTAGTQLILKRRGADAAKRRPM